MSIASRGRSLSTEATGAPILDDCLAWLDCRVVATHVVGDHTLFIGEAGGRAEYPAVDSGAAGVLECGLSAG